MCTYVYASARNDGKAPRERERVFFPVSRRLRKYPIFFPEGGRTFDGEIDVFKPATKPPAKAAAERCGKYQHDALASESLSRWDSLAGAACLYFEMALNRVWR